MFEPRFHNLRLFSIQANCPWLGTCLSSLPLGLRAVIFHLHNPEWPWLNPQNRIVVPTPWGKKNCCICIGIFTWNYRSVCPPLRHSGEIGLKYDQIGWAKKEDLDSRRIQTLALLQIHKKFGPKCDRSTFGKKKTWVKIKGDEIRWGYVAPRLWISTHQIRWS